MRKLFCTFVPIDTIDSFIEEITSIYTFQHNKIFILEIDNDLQEYICTYNIDAVNLSSIPENTLSIHRKKESNTLYTINALNEMIKLLNGGVVNNRYPIDWNQYKNTLLLTQDNRLKELKTKIFNIIEI
jgi:hypothetical protein